MRFTFTNNATHARVFSGTLECRQCAFIRPSTYLSFQIGFFKTQIKKSELFSLRPEWCRAPANSHGKAIRRQVPGLPFRVWRTSGPCERSKSPVVGPPVPGHSLVVSACGKVRWNHCKKCGTVVHAFTPGG